MAMHRLIRIIRREEGATIIEFALVVPVVLLLLFGIIEFSLLMFASGVVEGATTNAGRLARTGAERATTGTPAERAQADSARIRAFILQRGAGFLQDEHLNVAALPQGASQSGTMGESGEIVIYNVTYNWRVSTPFIGRLIAPPNGVYSISSTNVVVNEPFGNDPD